MEAYLPTIWFLILATSILIYVVLDGFDLGVGVLFGLAPNEDYRHQMISTVEPVWDGNETWLVMIGAGLYGAFPMVYATVLPALYLPLILMLLALIFRGVAFEFRHQAKQTRPLWGKGFFIGSCVAAFCQGAAIGTVFQGIPVANGSYVGGAFIWLNPFAILCGFGLVFGYAMLGSGWLIMKTEGPVQDWVFQRGRRFMLLSVLFMFTAFAIVVLTDDQTYQLIQARLHWLAIPGVVAFVAIVLLQLAYDKRWERMPFFMAVLIFLAAFTTLAMSFWPYILPYSVTYEEAAAGPKALSFLFYGAGIIVFPMILIYTCTVYWIFRGKIRPQHNYHG